jgi:hypothetical protein
VVVSTPDPAAVLAIASRRGVPANEIGKVGNIGEAFVLTIGNRRFETPVERLATAYHGAIPARMAKVATSTDQVADVGLPATPG